MIKKIFVVLLTLILSLTAVFPAFAQVASDEVTCVKGELVTLTFSYEQIKGIDGIFEFSDPSLIASVGVVYEGLVGVYNADKNQIALAGTERTDCVITVTVTLVEGVAAGTVITVDFVYDVVYETGHEVLENQRDTVSIVVKDAVDYTELERLITAAQALKAEDYTVDSWNNLTEALENALAARESDDQQVVNAAAEALSKAIDALVPASNINYTELDKQIAIAQALDESLYTADSWADLTVALENALEARESEDQEIVNKAAKWLKNAIAALIEMDYDELNKQIAIAQGLKKKDYTSDSWKVMQDALADALEAKQSRDQEVVKKAAKALKDAIAALVKVSAPSIDYTELDKQIAAAQALNKDDYTAESWENLETALREAIAARDSEEQQVVNAAAQKLADAIAALVKVEKVDYTELDAQIAIAEGLNKNDYTAESWANLETALQAAKAARESNDQQVVNAAVQALKDAIAALVKVSAPSVDYTELEKQIAAAQALNKDDYTAESWAKLDTALQAAIAARESKDQAVVDAAAQALADAIAALEKASSNWWIWLLIALAVVAIVIIVVVILKKKNKK